MRHLYLIGALLFAVTQFTFAQDRVFGWTPANAESVQLDPAEIHTGRTYHAAPGGGNIHVGIETRLPVTLAMTWADEWDYAQSHPAAFAHLEFRCVQEHVVKTIYECHLPSDRPMVLTIRDERTPQGAVLQGIDAVLGTGVRRFIAPNHLYIQYHSWSCVENCLQPEFQWSRLVKEKYEVTSAPKMYNLLTPDHDDQQLSVRIKSPIPVTIAVVPVQVADKMYDRSTTLSDALGQTGCKQRGVQSLSFQCSFNVADGPQSIVILPDVSISGHKKAEVELQTVQCSANCNLLPQNR